jgi:hypothetical protein
VATRSCGSPQCGHRNCPPTILATPLPEPLMLRACGPRRPNTRTT